MEDANIKPTGPACAAIFLVVALCCLHALGVAQWVFGLPILEMGSVLVLLPAALLCAALSRRHGGFAWDASFWLTVGTTLALAFTVAALGYDLSYDGQSYHQAAIQVLQGGWRAGQPVQPANIMSIWIEHYPAASWLVGSNIASLVGHIEAARAQNIIWLVASMLLAHTALRQQRSFSAAVAMLLAVSLGANPVVLSQLFTNYNDGLLYSCLLTAASLFVLWLRSRSPLLLVAAALALSYAANLKFTGLVYAVLALAGACAALLVCGGGRRSAILCALCGVVTLGYATLVLGWFPYMSNLLDHGHPFWPLFGNTQVDIMSTNTPAALADESKLLRWLISNLSMPVAGSVAPNPVWRGNWGLDSFAVMGGADVRIGGFGALHPLILLALTATAGLALAVKPSFPQELSRHLLLIAAVFALPVIVNPQNWWARYVPQQWAVLACLLAVLTTANYRTIRRLALLGLILMSVNAVLVLVASVRSNWRGSAAWAQTLTTLQEQSRGQALDLVFGEQVGLKARLFEAGVRYREVDVASCQTFGNPLPNNLAYLSTLRVCQYGASSQAAPAESLHRE